MTNLDKIIKSRDITEHQRIDAFELWCWRRLKSSFDCKEIKPANPKGNQPEQTLEGLMLKLRLQYFCHLRWRADSLVKTLMLGKIEGKRRRGWQGMRCLDGFIDSMDMSLNNRDIVKDREAWYGAVCGVTKSRTQLSDWTTHFQSTYISILSHYHFHWGYFSHF